MAEDDASGAGAGSDGAFSSATALLLAHPGAHLLGHALRLRVDHLLELAADRIGLALGALLAADRQAVAAARLELGHRRGRLDLAQPDGLPHQRLRLAAAQVAGDE